MTWFQASQKALYAVPLSFPGLIAAFPERVTMQHPLLMFGGQVFPGCIDRNVGTLGVLFHFNLTFFIAWCLPGFDRTAFEGFILVRDHQAKVDADDPTKTSTRLTSAQGRVKRKRAGQSVAVADVAIRAVQLVAKFPDSRIRSILIDSMHRDQAVAHFEGDHRLPIERLRLPSTQG